MRPRLVIGSDRLELYDFFKKRKELWNQQSKNWLKLSAGLTALHFVTVRVPELFSRYFGDEIGTIGQKMGAEDQRHVQ